MDVGTLGSLFTVVVFGLLGWYLARRRARPAGKGTYAWLIVLAVAGGGLGASTRLLDVFGFAVTLGLAIAAGCVGAIVGSLTRGAGREAPAEN